ncbi:MAG: hypothetical protein R2911_43930 [Caldilineaceae bacterium]
MAMASARDLNDGTAGAGDADSDGINDDVECPGGYICPDSDGDGIPNYMDTDSDNDGLTDATEGTTDTDGDGIPTASINIIDTDGDGNTDYNQRADGDKHGQHRWRRMASKPVRGMTHDGDGVRPPGSMTARRVRVMPKWRQHQRRWMWQPTSAQIRW